MKYPVLMGLLVPLGALAIAVPLVSLAFTPDTPPAASSTTTSSAAADSTTTASSASSATGAAAQSTETPSTATQTATSQASPAPASISIPAQYADQMRGVIDQAASTAYTTDASYTIGTIPQDTPALIPGQDVEVVQTNCSVCHATTFISSQPPLPGSTWHDEVYKMKEKYGATFISDDNANKIIAYLSAHYTPETHKPGDSSAGTVATATPAATTSTPAQAGAVPASATTADGAKIYAANCSSCHGAAGAGVPGAFPPLAGNKAIVGDDKYIADVLLGGLQGQIAVNGQTYSGVMPAWAAQLSDTEIAAVATHVRSSWGNAGAAVSADTVKAERAAAKPVSQVLSERPQ